MKIAVATNNNQTVAGHVGKCKTFLIYETDGSKITHKITRINSFTNHGLHSNQDQEHHNHGKGQGHHDHHNLIEGLKDCEALIFNHGGWRLIEDLKTHNIVPVLTDEKYAEDAVLKYLKGELSIKEENVCSGHNH